LIRVGQFIRQQKGLITDFLDAEVLLFKAELTILALQAPLFADLRVS